VSMNLALGTLYGWSVFVAPLKKQFGWKRDDTSMVFTIAVVVFALTFVVAGRIQDKIGPLCGSLAGGILVSLGFLSLLVHHQFDVPVCVLRRNWRPGQRVRLCHADTRDGQMVP